LQTSTLDKKSVPLNGTVPQMNDVFELELERSPTASPGATCGVCPLTPPGLTCTSSGGVSYCAIAPQRVACGIRNVATFGAGAQGTAFEVRSDTNAVGTPIVAQGAAGFNIPSLLSLATTAPYLHNGAAPTLVDLFTNPAFKSHTTAGDPNFSPPADKAQDLANFLLSIESTTTAPAPPDGFDLCTRGAVQTNNNACNNP
jgi:hypothetical protein